jgi:hypothetical protein
MITASRALTYGVVALALLAISAVAYNQFVMPRYTYDSELQYSFVKTSASYDYSCGTKEYQVTFTIKNTGSKNVVDLSGSVTHPDCIGSIVILPKALNASASINFAVQTVSENGTLTFSGNNTMLLIMF